MTKTQENVRKNLEGDGIYMPTYSDIVKNQDLMNHGICYNRDGLCEEDNCRCNTEIGEEEHEIPTWKAVVLVFFVGASFVLLVCLLQESLGG